MLLSRPEYAAHEIAAKVQAGNPVTFFVGSFVSSWEAGIPAVPEITRQIWTDIIDNLQSHGLSTSLLDLPRLLDPVHNNIQFEMYFQLYNERVDAGLAKWACDAMKGGHPGATHRFLGHIATIYPNVVLVTTNFDQMLEYGVSTSLEPLISEDDFRAHGSTSRLVKLHGCVSQPDSLAINMRQIARGLAVPAGSWLDGRVAASTFIYLGWGANDFDIYPRILSRSSLTAQDVVTIRPKKSMETDLAYEEDNLRPKSIADARGGQLVPNYMPLIETLMREFHFAGTIDHVAPLPLGESPIKTLSLERCLSYVLSLLEYSGNVYQAQSLLAQVPGLSRYVDAATVCSILQQGGRFNDMAHLGRRRAWRALLACDHFEIADGLNDFATARSNQRYIWHAGWNWIASNLVCIGKPQNTRQWDIYIRARHHWAVGLGIISDVLSRGRIPGQRWFRRMARARLEEVEKASRSGENKYRETTGNLEKVRFSTYDASTDVQQALGELEAECRSLIQLGRAQDLTVAIERGLEIALPRTDVARLRQLFAEWFVILSLETALRRGWPMVALKCAMRFPEGPGILDRGDFRKRMIGWAFTYDQFGLWHRNIRPANIVPLSPEEYAREGIALADYVKQWKDDLVDILLN